MPTSPAPSAAAAADETADDDAAPRRTRQARLSPAIKTLMLRGLLTVASLFAVLLLATIGERIVYSGQLLPGIEIEGIDVEGFSTTDAYARVDRLADRLEQDLIDARADGTDLALDPSAVHLRVDRRATVLAASGAGRSANPFSAVGGFVMRRIRHEPVTLRISYEPEAVEGVIDGWQGLVTDRVIEGALRFDGTDVVVVAPRAGSAIDRDDARRQLTAILRSTHRSRIDLRVAEIEPTVEIGEVQALAAKARAILSSGFRVSGPRGTATPPPIDGAPLDLNAEVTIAPADVAATLSTFVRDGEIGLQVDEVVLGERLDTEDDVFITLPKPASFAILLDGSVGIVESINGQELDLRKVGREIVRNRHEIAAPFRVVKPERDTAWARGLGIKEVVATFTTHHSCCAERVKNIHTAADYMTNTVVEPGAEFSLNDAVGPRTPERGFVSAPVFYGEFTEDFGGGVSQLATTTFNAAFWGGLEIIDHKPHSIYFDRYPIGREATVNYPSLDLRWRNNSDHGILVTATYTGEAITVTLFGDREGRVVSEQNEDGSCSVRGSTDRITEQRCVNILETTPITEKLIPCNEATPRTDPDGECPRLAPGQRESVADGHEGYIVEFWRVVERPGQEPERERFWWHYQMYPDTYLVGVSNEPPTTAPPITTAPPPTVAPPPTTAPPTTTTP